MLSRLLTQHRITHQIAQLYSKLTVTPCPLCNALTNKGSVCQQCDDTLPRIEQACTRCAVPTPMGQICGQCLKQPPLRQFTTSIFHYQYPVDKLITQFKFNQRLHLSDYLASQLAAKIANRHQPLPQQLIPIPLHPSRLKKRGYNQATELAKVLSKQLTIPVNQHSLMRIKATAPQSQLPFNERKRNLAAAFDCQNKPEAEHIALIDDVLTTGYTAEAATKALMKQGVKTVELWTIARSIRDHD